MIQNTKRLRWLAVLLLSLMLAFQIEAAQKVFVEKNGTYTSKEQVAAYIHKFGKLPGNYITKGQARELGWVSSQGNLNKVAPGKSIGGDTFTNRQHVLPDSDDKYIECDINANGTSRGAERIVYNTGDYKVYYTDDHYSTFKEV